jgi:dTDP-4-dehydrorhamnose reductase
MGLEIHAPCRADIDVRDTHRVAECITSHKPQWVVNFSAFHVLEACEEDFTSAMLINAVAVREMALCARYVGSRFLTVSTDYVFDGACSESWCEGDEARPIQAYGVSKRAGELAALAAAPDHCFVVRTCGLYGHHGSRDRGGNFVEKRLAEACGRAQIEVGSDLICTPTSAGAFATAVLRLLEEPNATAGIYHLTAQGACSWAEFTAEVLKLARMSCVVIPVDRRGNYGRVRRPANSVLRNVRARALGITLPHWKDDLASHMQQRIVPSKDVRVACPK